MEAGRQGFAVIQLRVAVMEVVGNGWNLDIFVSKAEPTRFSDALHVQY